MLVFGVTKGISKGVGDDYYVITEPLEKGNYTILYKSSYMSQNRFYKT